MSHRINLQDATGVYLYVPNVGIMGIVGSGAPTNGQAGYGTGCIYNRTDGGSNTSIYVNEGSNTSTTWTAK